VRCRKTAQRRSWRGSPVWTDVDRAGAKFYISGAGTHSAIKITAKHVSLTGCDFQSTSSDSGAQFGCVVDLTTQTGPAPVFVGCSFCGKGINFVQSSSCYALQNCHSEGGFVGFAEGYFTHCSACGYDSFYKSGSTVSTLIENCIFVNESSEMCALDDVLFFDCDLYSASGAHSVFIYETGTGFTEDTIFEECRGTFEKLLMEVPN
jgi:hypothetical protein